MGRKAFCSDMLILVLCLLIPATWADPTIIVDTRDPFTVSCDTSPPTSWTMVVGGLARVTVPLGSRPGIVNCSFVSVQKGVAVHQDFAVQPTAVAGVECDPDSCEWTVTPDGFYVLDETTEREVLGFSWLA